MELNLSGRTVVVTGGSRGIGFACAKIFLEEGCRVALIARDAGRLGSASRELGVADDRLLVRSADLSDPIAAASAIAAIEQSLGPIDVLVNSAGAAKRSGPDELSPAAYREAMDAKFFPYVNAIDPVLKGMVTRGAGVIVNVIGSGGKSAMPFHIAGGAANSALMLVTAGLGKAYAARGIRVVGLNPGRTLTDRVEEGLAVEARVGGVSVEEARRLAQAEIPLGRFARPEEIARMVVFVASDAASYLTGVTIAMDGAAVPVI
jgi:NAD(P)-dependent dehydrogenase (short-subunit alcohol dehydrogenase family)